MRGALLEEFGRALGRIESEGDRSGDEVRLFLDDVVKGLTAPDGRVIPVRLSLFAEVVRHRPWTHATLQALGGVDGIGVKFLEDRFESDSSPYRLHRHAAQAILRALLPPPASVIRGLARTESELRTASGYADRPDDFHYLMRILDSELRLITTTEEKEERERIKDEGGRTKGNVAVPSGSFSASSLQPFPLIQPSASSLQPFPLIQPSALRYYQLAHDYLIPPIRRWLEREQRSTRAGRARLRLEAITAAWLERPVPRRLPSFPEWVGIISHVRPAERSPDEARLLRATARHYFTRFAMIAAVFALLVVIRQSLRDREAGRSLLRAARTADDRKLQALIPELEPYQSQLSRELEADENAPPSSKRAHDRELAGVLLYRFAPSAARGLYLRELLLLAPDPDRVDIIRESLAVHPKHSDPGALWRVANDKTAAPGERLRAIAALARLEPSHANWKTTDPIIARALLGEDRRTIPRWIELLEPVLAVVVSQLDLDVRNPELSLSWRAVSAEALAEALGRRGEGADFAGPIAEAPPEAFHILVRGVQRFDCAQERSRRWLRSSPAKRRMTPTRSSAMATPAVRPAPRLPCSPWAIPSRSGLDCSRPPTRGFAAC